MSNIQHATLVTVPGYLNYDTCLEAMDKLNNNANCMIVGTYYNIKNERTYVLSETPHSYIKYVCNKKDLCNITLDNHFIINNDYCIGNIPCDTIIKYEEKNGLKAFIKKQDAFKYTYLQHIKYNIEFIDPNTIAIKLRIEPSNLKLLDTFEFDQKN
jgi:hypothetical protein